MREDNKKPKRSKGKCGGMERKSFADGFGFDKGRPLKFSGSCR
jgi:hypothetical protein